MMTKLAVTVRGHIRDAFQTDRFVRFLEQLGHQFDVDIYLHTWHESEAKNSYRPVNRESVFPVSALDVSAYFRTVQPRLRTILVDNDEQIELVGTTIGTIGCAPLKAWKNMWYGKYRVCQALWESRIAYDLVLNLRIDVFSLSQSADMGLTEARINQRLTELSDSTPIQQLHFFAEKAVAGIDNCYIGNPELMCRISHHFHFNLDDIRERYRDIYNQEFVVFHESRQFIDG